jgi:hypothetical protein
MSGLFGKAPSMPKPPAAPPTAIDSGKEKTRYDVMARLMRRRRSTLLNQATSEPTTIRPTLGSA